MLSAANGAILSGGNLATGASITANSATLLEGTINVSSGSKVANGTLTGSGAALSAYSGSVISNVSIGSGTRLYLGSGAAGSANVVNGGTLEISSGASPSNNKFGNNTGGTIIIDSGATWNNNNNPTYGATSGNTLIIKSGGTVSGTVIESGGTTIVSSGGVLLGTQTVSSGGTLVLNGTAGSGIVSLSGDGAHLVISGTAMPTNTISNWSPTDTIDLASVPKSSVTSVTTTSTGITFYTKSGNYSLNVPDANKYGYALSADSNGGLVYTTCFAEGTLIKTPSGEAAVETLAPGSMVMTPEGAMPLKWLGHRSIDVSKQINPEANWLVRICAGALADHVPARDLLVTQEHCMVFDGKLVPARMLVNGISIYLDRSINAYTYYHVELDTHMPIWAEGALTESYLDTGNRDQFENHYVTSIMSDRCEVGSDFLPLDTSRAFVEPIFRRLVDRTGLVPSVPALVDDADLHLATETGEVIRASRISGAYHMFMLPDNVETVTIASRTSRPSDVIGPFMDDRRELGVLVGEAKLFCAYKTVSLNVTETSLARKGWYESDALGRRWTNGAASLHIGSATQGEPRMLTLQILSQGPYLREVQQTVLRATA
ncbi:Hint domain-containing protein [Neokomagataea tanensis]|uniref:Hint domain-containing protein n=1 Tax=Neokomagataea tanensis TaxID=661191 RepID=UPI001F10F68A|nr:Hint domain-containing protein [Neokomagataea tanensis]